MCKLRAAAVLGLLFSLLGVPNASAQNDFYAATSAELAGPPGTMIRHEEHHGGGVGKVYRVLYRSTGLAGEPIAVSGLVIVPHGEAPSGGRDIVAWAHPTTGVVQSCAPSLERNVLETIPGLSDFLSRGYVVVATDYPGLGTAGTHPYLVGTSEGRAVLDSVRAARAIEEASAGDRFAVWGHSQGGHAALFAGELAASYAPELKLVGVAAAAPAVELGALVEAEANTMNGNILTALAVWSWSRVYSTPLESIVNPAAVPAVDQIAGTCLESVRNALTERKAEHKIVGGFLAADPSKVEPWKKFLTENSPGTRYRNVPLLIARSTSDADIPPAISANFVERLCHDRAHVRVVTLDGVAHYNMGIATAEVAVGWIGDRFDGVPAPNSCP